MTLLDVMEAVSRLPAEVWIIPPVVIFSGIVAIGVGLHRARNRRFRAIAARSGLAMKPGIVNPSKVHGTFHGRALVMFTCSPQRTTFFRRTWTRVAVDVENPSFLGLHLRPQDVVDTMVRMPDVRIGDAEFDRRYLLMSNEPDLVKKLFADRALRESLLRANVDTVRMHGSPMEVYYAREERSAEHAMLLFTACAQLADAVDALEPEAGVDIMRAT